MRCKNHPAREAKHYCAGCRIPICDECAEEVKPGAFYCFRCAMLTSVTQMGSTLILKKEKAQEKKAKEIKKWGPFRYFVVASSVLIAVMWGVIIFGGEKPPTGSVDIAKNERAFLFMVDSAVKRFAHYEGNTYPDRLSELVPKYLHLRKENISLLQRFSYNRDPSVGYRLTVTRPKPGEMTIILSSKGIKYELPSKEGA